MAELDLTPSAATQPLPRLVLAHAGMETRLLVRNGEQLLLALVIPLLILVAGTEAKEVLELSGRRIDVLTPGVLALAVMSSSFTSLAIATGFERRYQVLKRLGATPLSRTGLLLGKVLALLTVEAGQILAICIVALLLGWQPHGGVLSGLSALLLVVLGTAAFAGLGLLMAGTLRAEATLAAANLVYVVLLVAGAVVVPASEYPHGMAEAVALLPSGALAEGLRQTLSGGSPGLVHLAVLLAWAVAAGGLTVRTFRWQ